MERTVTLPCAKSENLHAKLENGILYVTVPKEAGRGNTRKIDIE